MGVALLVLMLLPGRRVLASCASLLPFLVVCIGLSTLWTCGILFLLGSSHPFRAMGYQATGTG